MTGEQRAKVIAQNGNEGINYLTSEQRRGIELRSELLEVSNIASRIVGCRIRVSKECAVSPQYLDQIRKGANCYSDTTSNHSLISKLILSYRREIRSMFNKLNSFV